MAAAQRRACHEDAGGRFERGRLWLSMLCRASLAALALTLVAPSIALAASPTQPRTTVSIPKSHLPAPYYPSRTKASPARLTVQGSIVRLSGMITERLPAVLDEALREHPQVRTVLLDSPGGDALASIRTAEVIRRHGLTTMVPGNADCASACVILLAGGTDRVVAPATRVGVHSWKYAQPVTDEVRMTHAEMLRGVFASLNVAPSIVDLMLATPFEGMRWLSRGEMNQLGLITADAVWR